MPVYTTTALDPATVRLSRLRAGLFAGPGPAGFDALAATLRRASDAAADVAGDLDVLLRRDDTVHAGPAAHGARTHLAAVRADAAADAGRLDRAARAAGELAGHHAAARRDVAPAPDVLVPGRTSAAAMLGAALDGHGAGDERRARLAVAAYQDGCNGVLSRAPVFGRV